MENFTYTKYAKIIEDDGIVYEIILTIKNCKEEENEFLHFLMIQKQNLKKNTMKKKMSYTEFPK